MSRKPKPITLARIAADIIHGAEAEPATFGPRGVEALLERLAGDESPEASTREVLATMPLPAGKVARETADELGQRISDAWGMLKAHDSTGNVVIQENAEGLWYAIWRDHAGAVIAESTPVTTAEQAGKLVAWMRDNAAAAPEEVVKGKFAEAQELAATAPTAPPPGMEHLIDPDKERRAAETARDAGFVGEDENAGA